MSEEINTPTEKKLDLLTQKTFTANGNNYHISSSISISRWKEYEKLEPRLTFGISFTDIFKQVKNAYNTINTKEGKVADVAVILHNLMNGIKGIEDKTREHPAMLMAALVINREGEDIGVFDESIQLSKIKDWELEGYDILPFFTFALNSIQGFRETYVEYISAEIIKNNLKKEQST